MLKYEVSISDGLMIGASNRTLGIYVRYCKMLFQSYFLKVNFVKNVRCFNAVIVRSHIYSNTYIFWLFKIILVEKNHIWKKKRKNFDKIDIYNNYFTEDLMEEDVVEIIC